jgi:hypothetical protein
MATFSKFDLTATIQHLENLKTVLNASLETVPYDEIVVRLLALANVLSVSVPEGDGLALYVMAIHDLPLLGHIRAQEKIIATLKYPRMPLPAEYLEAGVPAGELAKLMRIKINRLIQSANIILNAA